jgi:hypothetical protein
MAGTQLKQLHIPVHNSLDSIPTGYILYIYKLSNKHMEKEWDDEVEKVHHDVHEPTTYELAEAELQAEYKLHGRTETA